MGYEIYTRPFGNWLLPRLKKLTEGKPWQRVGKNAETTAWKQYGTRRFPVSADLALERFQTGEKMKHMLLLHYGDDPVTTQDLAVWFNFYNARQTIEAGNKEGKGTFAMRYLKVRSRPGLYLQERVRPFRGQLCALCFSVDGRTVPTTPKRVERPGKAQGQAAGSSRCALPQPKFAGWSKVVC